MTIAYSTRDNSLERLTRLHRSGMVVGLTFAALSCSRHEKNDDRHFVASTASVTQRTAVSPPSSFPKENEREAVPMVRVQSKTYSVRAAGKGAHPMAGLPKGKVELKSFEIDRSEVTVVAYSACVRAAACTTDGLAANNECNWSKSNRENHPINCVTYAQAEAFCRWNGKRIPTEVEWEVALDEDLLKGGIHGGYYRSACTTGESPVGCPSSHGKKSPPRTCVVGTHPFKQSRLGILDIFGNVAEWTTGRYCNWNAKWCESNVVRGTAWCANSEEDLWMRRVGAEARAPESSTAAPQLVGFRCAR